MLSETDYRLKSEEALNIHREKRRQDAQDAWMAIPPGDRLKCQDMVHQAKKYAKRVINDPAWLEIQKKRYNSCRVDTRRSTA